MKCLIIYGEMGLQISAYDLDQDHCYQWKKHDSSEKLKVPIISKIFKKRARK